MIAHTIEELAGLPNATYVGGGTDLFPLLKNHVRDDANLVFLHELPELQAIAEQGNCIELGAGVTLYDLAVNARLRESWPALAQAAQATASPQIRNIATLGGNVLQDRRCIYYNQSRFWRGALPPCFKTGGTVCHQIPNSPTCKALYYSDLATALVLYEAEAECLEADARSWVPVRSLIARHSAANGLACAQHLPVLVLRFRVPRPPQGEASGFHKYALRASIDFPLINFALRCHGTRPPLLVAGAVADQPVLLPDTAALLNRADSTDDELLRCCEAELKKYAAPIKEACIPPAIKRTLYGQVEALLALKR